MWVRWARLTIVHTIRPEYDVKLLRPWYVAKLSVPSMTGKGFRVCRSQDQGSCAPSLLQSIVAFHVWGQRPHPIPPSRTTHCGPLPSSITGVAVFCEAVGSWGRPRGAECVAQLHPSLIIIMEVYDHIPSPPFRPLIGAQCLHPIARSPGVCNIEGLGLAHPTGSSMIHTPLHTTYHYKPVGFYPETV